MSAKKQHYANLSNSIIKKFHQRGFEGYYCQTKEDALAKALEFLPLGCTISWGGSETLNEIGLFQHLSPSNYTILDRFSGKTQEEKNIIYSQIVTSDYYFMSSNAITLDGQLVNIDGAGNRVACLITGPKNVIIIAGMNKIVSDVNTGIERVQNMAAPPNANRLHMNTPCAELGRCANCLTEDCLCCEIVITRKSRIPNRIKVILVGEELGF